MNCILLQNNKAEVWNEIKKDFKMWGMQFSLLGGISVVKNGCLL